MICHVAPTVIRHPLQLPPNECKTKVWVDDEHHIFHLHTELSRL